MSTTVIIGAGHAGSQCAVSLRSEGYDGSIVLINNDHAVPYHKPPLSKKTLKADQPDPIPLRARSAYEKANVEFHQDSVKRIDTLARTVELADGTTLAFDHLVIATGAQNRQLQTVAHCSNVFSLRTLDDAANIHAALASASRFGVLGGGFIGLEVAACLATMDKKVTVIEAANQLLGRVVSAPIASKISDGLQDLGIEVITGCSDSEFIINHDRLQSVKVSEQSNLNFDALLVGIGAIPNVELAKEAGLSCDNGIVVDSNLETSAKGIFAIGDCAQFPHWQTQAPVRLESVQNAVDQAKCVAKTIASETSTSFKTVPWFWSDIGEMKLQIAGIHSGETEQVFCERDSGIALYHLQNQRVVCVESLNSVKDHMLARKLIDQGTLVEDTTIQAGTDELKQLLSS